MNTPSRAGEWPLRLLLAAICLAFVACLLPALHGPFLFDDFPNLEALSSRGAISSWADLGAYLAEARSFPGRPLSMLSFLPQQADWPANPLPFKTVNLLLHALNATLIFVLARLLAARLPRPIALSPGALAAIVAVAWLVHPMQLSVFLLVIQRMTLLAATFVLLGLLAYARGVTASDAGPWRRACWMIAGMACAVPALLSKENGILLPLYALVMDATLLRADVIALPRSLRWLRRVLLFPVIAVLAWLAVSQLGQLGTTLPIRDFSIGERLLSQPRVLLDYLTNITFPRYDVFSVYHDDFRVSTGLMSPPGTLPALLVLLAAFATAIAGLKRWPLAAFGILWFLAGHSIEAGPVSLELYFEHRNYVPLFGVIFSVACGVAGMREGVPRRVACLLASAWLACALLATALYAQVWTSADRLAYFWAAAHPHSIRAQSDFANSLTRNGEMEKAREVIATMARSHPDDAGVAAYAVYLDCYNGKLVADDVTALGRRLAVAAWSRPAYQSLAQLATIAPKQCPAAIDDAAWLALTDALLSNPNFQADPVAIGFLHYQRHLLAVRRGDLDGTIRELDATAKADPDPEIVRLKAKYLVDAGRVDLAVEALSQYDGSRRPLLRRLLVDDAAINQRAIEQLLRHPPARDR